MSTNFHNEDRIRIRGSSKFSKVSLFTSKLAKVCLGVQKPKIKHHWSTSDSHIKNTFLKQKPNPTSPLCPFLSWPNHCNPVCIIDKKNKCQRIFTMMTGSWSEAHQNFQKCHYLLQNWEKCAWAYKSPKLSTTDPLLTAIYAITFSDKSLTLHRAFCSFLSWPNHCYPVCIMNKKNKSQRIFTMMTWSGSEAHQNFQKCHYSLQNWQNCAWGLTSPQSSTSVQLLTAI